ncbi:MAG: hypothetical protein ACREMS_09740 [Gemmatimonadaceae bacterium]
MSSRSIFRFNRSCGTRLFTIAQFSRRVRNSGGTNKEHPASHETTAKKYGAIYKFVHVYPGI